MQFLKNFFDDESKIIGLCGFEKNGHSYSKKNIIDEVLFNEVNFKKTFETNFAKNALLF